MRASSFAAFAFAVAVAAKQEGHAARDAQGTYPSSSPSTHIELLPYDTSEALGLPEAEGNVMNQLDESPGPESVAARTLVTRGGDQNSGRTLIARCAQGATCGEDLHRPRPTWSEEGCVPCSGNGNSQVNTVSPPPTGSSSIHTQALVGGSTIHMHSTVSALPTVEVEHIILPTNSRSKESGKADVTKTVFAAQQPSTSDDIMNVMGILSSPSKSAAQTVTVHEDVFTIISTPAIKTLHSLHTSVVDVTTHDTIAVKPLSRTEDFIVTETAIVYPTSKEAIQQEVTVVTYYATSAKDSTPVVYHAPLTQTVYEQASSITQGNPEVETEYVFKMNGFMATLLPNTPTSTTNEPMLTITIPSDAISTKIVFDRFRVGVMSVENVAVATATEFVGPSADPLTEIVTVFSQTVGSSSNEPTFPSTPVFSNNTQSVVPSSSTSESPNTAPTGSSETPAMGTLPASSSSSELFTNTTSPTLEPSAPFGSNSSTITQPTATDPTSPPLDTDISASSTAPSGSLVASPSLEPSAPFGSNNSSISQPTQPSPGTEPAVVGTAPSGSAPSGSAPSGSLVASPSLEPSAPFGSNSSDILQPTATAPGTVPAVTGSAPSGSAPSGSLVASSSMEASAPFGSNSSDILQPTGTVPGTEPHITGTASSGAAPSGSAAQTPTPEASAPFSSNSTSTETVLPTGSGNSAGPTAPTPVGTVCTESRCSTQPIQTSSTPFRSNDTSSVPSGGLPSGSVTAPIGTATPSEGCTGASGCAPGPSTSDSGLFLGNNATSSSLPPFGSYTAPTTTGTSPDTSSIPTSSSTSPLYNIGTNTTAPIVLPSGTAPGQSRPTSESSLPMETPPSTAIKSNTTLPSNVPPTGSFANPSASSGPTGSYTIISSTPIYRNNSCFTSKILENGSTSTGSSCVTSPGVTGVPSTVTLPPTTKYITTSIPTTVTTTVPCITCTGGYSVVTNTIYVPVTVHKTELITTHEVQTKTVTKDCETCPGGLTTYKTVTTCNVTSLPPPKTSLKASKTSITSKPTAITPPVKTVVVTNTESVRITLPCTKSKACTGSVTSWSYWPTTRTHKITPSPSSCPPDYVTETKVITKTATDYKCPKCSTKPSTSFYVSTTCWTWTIPASTSWVYSKPSSWAPVSSSSSSWKWQNTTAPVVTYPAQPSTVWATSCATITTANTTSVVTYSTPVAAVTSSWYSQPPASVPTATVTSQIYTTTKLTSTVTSPYTQPQQSAPVSVPNQSQPATTMIAQTTVTSQTYEQNTVYATKPVSAPQGSYSYQPSAPVESSPVEVSPVASSQPPAENAPAPSQPAIISSSAASKEKKPVSFGVCMAALVVAVLSVCM